jgi:hypothetical protein
MMDVEAFWRLIDDAGADADASTGTFEEWRAAVATTCEDRLATLPPDEIVQFVLRQWQLSNRAHDWRLWGAAHLIQDGCTYDEFHAFRDGLVSMGRDWYERALTDPDSLADHPAMTAEAVLVGNDAFDYLGTMAYRQVTGRVDGLGEALEASPEFELLEEPGELSGEKWDFEDHGETRRRLPRLSAIFLRNRPTTPTAIETAQPQILDPATEMMALDDFWRLIEEAGVVADARSGDFDERCDAIVTACTDRLATMTADEIVRFSLRQTQVWQQAYDQKLWGAAYLIEGGCGDDGFMDFRQGLISMGREWYERALADPDSLADHPAVATEKALFISNVDFNYVADEAYTRVTDIPNGLNQLLDTLPHEHPHRGPDEPTGENWDVEDDAENRRRLPRLSAIYLDHDATAK